MPSSPRKGAKASAAATTAAPTPSQPSEPSTSTSMPQLSKAHELAELIATHPERLANPDTSLSQLSVSALKQLFDHAVHSEKHAVPAICSFINTIAPNAAAPEQRASRSGGKRKRGQAAPAAAPVFEATPLDELITQGMDSRQLWEQLDLKASQMSRLVERYFAQGLIREEEEDEEDEDESSRAGPSRTRKHTDDDDSSDDDDDDDSDGQEDDEEFDPEEERVKLSQLSDADLRALGIDPALREQFLAELAQEQGDDDDDDEDSDEEGSPYAGASDISDGDPTEVFYEPLKTEAEQLRRKEEQEMGMLPRLRSQVGDDDDDDDEYEQQDSDEQDDIESEEEQEQEQSPNKRGKSARASDIPGDLLQDLDRPGEAATRPAKRHPTLDDDFFSIDDLNKQLDEQDAEEEADPADESEEEDLDNQVDFYKPLAGDQDMDDDDDQDDADDAAEAAAVDAADAHYADFFLPPAKAERFNKKFGKRKASARFASQDAAADEQADDDDDESEEESESAEPAVRVHEEPDRKRSIRFNDTIEYRRIKPRKKSADDLTPEMLRMIGASSDDVDAARDFDMDDDHDDQESSGQDDDDDDEDMDMDEVESETSSIGRHASDDEEEHDDDEEDEDRADMSEDESEGSQAGSDDGQGAKTARRVAGDLFADSDDEEDAQAKLSTHEKRVAALQEEIARLEDENVGKKEWTLMGEAGSRARPQNSLLEQDLEFERAAKVVPQVTEEMTESLEQLIKRRILERNFDDVIRRRELEALPFLPSRLLELSDSKSAKSLAELYEEEYQAARGGADGDEGAPVAEADAKLAKEHDEITQLYDDIFNKLDALSNAHFTPRAPKATIQTITNAPSVAMETALPATASSSTMLAPEEVYERAKHSTAMEGAKSEMTPEEKQRLHNKLRAEKRKRNDKIQDTQKALEMSGLVRAKKVNDKEEKQQALKKLVGNRGVSVIGKEPNATGAGSGKKNRKNANGAAAKPTTANQFKL